MSSSMKSQSVLKPILLLLLVFIAGQAFAQQPAWIDYAKRTAMYPESDYLVGFVSGNNTNNEEPGKLMDQYEELAKSKVVQSIEVSIETNNSLTLSNINGKSGEEFESKSISFSSATLTGLKSERYYDVKKKEVYAFAYVSKKELAYYNRKLITTNLQKIEQKLAEGKNFAKNNDKQNALKSFYEGMPLLAQAEEAQWLLMAINREQFVDKDLQEIRKKNAELNYEISQLQQSNGLNLSDAAYFIAYGIFLQIGETATQFQVSLCTYQNTGLTSDFSEKWYAELKNALVKTGNYKILETSKNENLFVTKGNYWEESGQLRIQVQVVNNDKIVAMAEGNVAISFLNNENIKYLPVQLEKIEQLNELKLLPVSGPEKLKIGQQSSVPFTVLVEKNNPENISSAENIPIIFKVKNGQAIGWGTSNLEGIASLYFPAVKLKEGKSEIEAQIDLAKYADLDTNSMYYLKISKNIPVAPAVFEVEFIPLIYFVESNETIDNKPVEIKIMEPGLKNILAEQGYQFVNQESEADYIIRVNASTTAGTTYNGIYFSYVDATMAIVDANTGVEKYKTSVEQVKGAGSNSQKAGIKALNLATEQLKKELIEYLKN